MNLKKYRELKGLSQSAVARELGISRQTYNNYELGKREADYETLLKLAEYFDTTVECLLTDSSKDSIDTSKTENLKYGPEINVLARHLLEVPDSDRSQIINMFENTIDIYLKAKGLK